MYFGKLGGDFLNFRWANFKKMRSDLNNVDSEQVFDCRSVNEKRGRFKRVILDSQCKLIPKVQKRTLKERTIHKRLRKRIYTAYLDSVSGSE